MNINMGVVALNVNNILVEKQLNNDQKKVTSGLKINDNVVIIHKQLDNSITGENLNAAESNIHNADMAEQILNDVKKHILSKSRSAILSQANQEPEKILSLLQWCGQFFTGINYYNI